MPAILSGNTHTPGMIIAEEAAAAIVARSP
jgi:choline dehydrogenase-like flavoprotein